MLMRAVDRDSHTGFPTNQRVCQVSSEHYALKIKPHSTLIQYDLWFPENPILCRVNLLKTQKNSFKKMDPVLKGVVSYKEIIPVSCG